MTTKSKTKSGAKPQKKLALRKDTVRDLSVGNKAKDIRGGKPTGNPDTDFCFGTLA